MDFYEKLLLEELKPAVEDLKNANPPVECTMYLYDAVTGRSSHAKLYPVLEEIFGPGGYFQHAFPPCKRWTGERKPVKCRRKSDGKEWIRQDKVMEFCDPCECKHPLQNLPASSPELNPAELGQNHLKYYVVPELLKEEGIEWKGSVSDKMEILKRAIAKFDSDKRWFAKAFASIRKRYEWIADNDGAIYSK